MDAVVFANLLLNGLNEGLLIALAAVAMTLVFGVARFANAATGDFMAFGAYGALLCHSILRLPLIAAMILAAAATALLALLCHRIVFAKLQHRAGVMSLLASIGIALFIRGFLILCFGHDQRTFDLPITRAINIGGTGILVQPLDVYVMVMTIVLIGAMFVLLHGSALGRRMRAVADNPVLAKASGIRAEKVLISLWLIVGIICACAGVFLGAKSVMTPDFGFDILLAIFTAAVLGGLGSPIGAVVGGISIGIMQELSAPIVGASYKLAVGFAVLLVLLLLRPQGIFGVRQSIR